MQPSGTVRLGPGGHTLAGDGAIVDHAVRVRRLPVEAVRRRLEG